MTSSFASTTRCTTSSVTLSASPSRSKLDHRGGASTAPQCRICSALFSITYGRVLPYILPHSVFVPLLPIRCYHLHDLVIYVCVVIACLCLLMWRGRRRHRAMSEVGPNKRSCLGGFGLCPLASSVQVPVFSFPQLVLFSTCSLDFPLNQSMPDTFATIGLDSLRTEIPSHSKLAIPWKTSLLSRSLTHTFDRVNVLGSDTTGHTGYGACCSDGP